MFGVIQYSMMLRNLPESHGEVIRHWLAFSQKHRETLLKGRFRAYHPESQYPILEAESSGERIFGVYVSGMIVPGGMIDRSVYVLNGTLTDDIVIDMAKDASARIFDAFGRSYGMRVLKRGIQRVKVPQGGYLLIEKDS